MEDKSLEDMTISNTSEHILVENMIRTQGLIDLLLEKGIINKDELQTKYDIISKTIVDIVKGDIK